MSQVKKKEKTINGVVRINKALASEILQCHHATINRMINRGRLKPPKYDKHTGEAWFEKDDVLSLSEPVLCDTYAETNVAGSR